VKAELEQQRAREKEERLDAEERARITKRPRHHDLDLHELAGGESIEQLSTQLKSVSEHTRRIGDPEAFDFDDNKRDQHYVEDLSQKLKDLRVVSRAKVRFLP
jgi:WD repeat-containing protein 76